MGSCITWVNPDCVNIDESRGASKAVCLAHARYNPFTSTTSNITTRSLNNTYGTGGVLGSYFADDFKMGSIVAKDLHFGVAASSFDLEIGILGAGQRPVKIPDQYPPTFIETLAAQGKINRYAFSLDLRSKGETGKFPFAPGT
jgi:hypothetical protein